MPYQQNNVPANSSTYKKRSDRERSIGKYIKSIVFGGLDGVVTTFVVVAGATGASLSTGVLLILGLGSLLGDAFSMGIGDYASSKSEAEYHEAERIHHEVLYEEDPTKERQKLIDSYVEKGLSVQESHQIAELLMKNKPLAVEIMMLNEHGQVEPNASPFTKGLFTFGSFIFFGFIPLLTYIIAPFSKIIQAHSFLTACILTGITLFSLGAMKVYITKRNWFFSGLQMMSVGGASATIAYIIGGLLAGIA